MHFCLLPNFGKFSTIISLNAFFPPFFPPLIPEHQWYKHWNFCYGPIGARGSVDLFFQFIFNFIVLSPGSRIPSSFCFRVLLSPSVEVFILVIVFFSSEISFWFFMSSSSFCLFFQSDFFSICFKCDGESWSNGMIAVLNCSSDNSNNICVISVLAFFCFPCSFKLRFSWFLLWHDFFFNCIWTCWVLSCKTMGLIEISCFGRPPPASQWQRKALVPSSSLHW